MQEVVFSEGHIVLQVVYGVWHPVWQVEHLSWLLATFLTPSSSTCTNSRTVSPKIGLSLSCGSMCWNQASDTPPSS